MYGSLSKEGWLVMTSKKSSKLDSLVLQMVVLSLVLGLLVIEVYWRIREKWKTREERREKREERRERRPRHGCCWIRLRCLQTKHQFHSYPNHCHWADRCISVDQSCCQLRELQESTWCLPCPY